jgi:hypothetical protein
MTKTKGLKCSANMLIPVISPTLIYWAVSQSQVISADPLGSTSKTLGKGSKT